MKIYKKFLHIFHLKFLSPTFSPPRLTFVLRFEFHKISVHTSEREKNSNEAHALSIVMCGNVLMFLLCNVMCFHTHLHVLHAYCCCYSLEMKRIMFMGAHDTLNVHVPILFSFLGVKTFLPTQLR